MTAGIEIIGQAPGQMAIWGSAGSRTDAAVEAREVRRVRKVPEPGKVPHPRDPEHVPIPASWTGDDDFDPEMATDDDVEAV